MFFAVMVVFSPAGGLPAGEISMVEAPVSVAWPVMTVILRALASWATPPTSFWTTASFFFISAARSSSMPASLIPLSAAWCRAHA